MKHTEEKWVMNSQLNLIIAGKKWIAELNNGGFERMSPEEDLANGKLILSAPDLLEALQELLYSVEYSGRSLSDRDGEMIEKPSSDIIEKSRKAIEKATNQQEIINQLKQ